MWMLTLIALAMNPAQACEDGETCTDSKCALLNPDAASETAEGETTEGETATAVPSASTVTLNISGMKCGACSAKITTVLEETEGVTAAAVNHESGTAEIVVVPENVTAEALIAVVAELGYAAALATE